MMSRHTPFCVQLAPPCPIIDCTEGNFGRDVTNRLVDGIFKGKRLDAQINTKDTKYINSLSAACLDSNNSDNLIQTCLISKQITEALPFYIIPIVIPCTAIHTTHTPWLLKSLCMHFPRTNQLLLLFQSPCFVALTRMKLQHRCYWLRWRHSL